jgi:hypothetical protein
MGKNIDRGLDKRVETQRSKDSSRKSPKTGKIKSDTAKHLNENFKKK